MVFKELVAIDLNLDAGESFEALTNGSEAALYDLVTSVNVACGGHAGDRETMGKAVHLAKQRGLNVGAHPSFPDLAGFGRVAMSLSHEALVLTLCEQIESLVTVCDQEKMMLTHVKPHGALYNIAANDRATAMAVIEATRRINKNLFIVGLAGTPFKDLCTKNGM